jgi:hypothetical protein
VYTHENLGGYFPQTQHHPMAITQLLDNVPETDLSDAKSQEIVDLIDDRFKETDHAPVAKRKESLLEGDRNSDTHILSKRMMQTYIASFWSHFHPQLPICKYFLIIEHSISYCSSVKLSSDASKSCRDHIQVGFQFRRLVVISLGHGKRTVPGSVTMVLRLQCRWCPTIISPFLINHR